MPSHDVNETIRLDTETLPSAVREEIWIEEFARTLFRIDLDIDPDQPLALSTTFRRLPGLCMALGTGGGYRASRTRAHIGAGCNEVMFHIQLASKCGFTQLGREALLNRGEGTLISGEDIATGDFSHDTPSHLAICMPQRELLSRLPTGEDSFARVIPAGTPALRLLAGYLSFFSNESVQSPSGLLKEVFVNHVHDLCAAAIEPTRETLEQSKNGLRAARLHAIKQDIRENLHQDVSVDAMTRRHAISPRYLHRLFELEGEATFAQYVLSVRLERAHLLLSDPLLAHRSVSYIAFQVGFSDLSHFNRAFKRQYKMTPTDCRAMARRER